MSIISLVSGSFCLGEEIASRLLERTSYARLSDDDIISSASERSGLAAAKIARAFTAKTSVFNSFTREKERSVAHLRLALAERLLDDALLVEGACGLLVPPALSHALRVCVIADMGARLDRAEAGGTGRKEAAKLIHRQDEDRSAWVKAVWGSEDPWAPDLYDLLIPTDKVDPDAAVELIMDNLSKQVVQPTPESRRAADDYLVAARVELVLAEEGHLVGVDCAGGAVTLTINRHVLMLSRLEEELKAIVGNVDGVASVSTKVGKDFYQPDIYRKMDFAAPSRVLLVDDEREFVQTLSERLEMRDVGSAVAYDGESALRIVEDDEPDVIILDLKMPGIDGIEVLRRVKQSRPHIEVIILTGHGSDEDCRVCMELGAFAYLQKPVDIDALSETLQRANDKVRALGQAGGKPSGEAP